MKNYENTTQHFLFISFYLYDNKGFLHFSPLRNLRSPASIQSIGDLNRQELRSIIGARNQVSVSTANVSTNFNLKI